MTTLLSYGLCRPRMKRSVTPGGTILPVGPHYLMILSQDTRMPSLARASFTLSSFSGRMNASTLFILSSSRAFTYCKDRSRTERQPQEARVFVPVETYTA